MPRLTHTCPVDMTEIPVTAFQDAFNRSGSFNEYCRCTTCNAIREAIWSGTAPIPVGTDRPYYTLIPTRGMAFPAHVGPHPAMSWTIQEIALMNRDATRELVSTLEHQAYPPRWAEPESDFEISTGVFAAINVRLATMGLPPWNHALGNSGSYSQRRSAGTVQVRVGRWSFETGYLAAEFVFEWHGHKWDNRNSGTCASCGAQIPTFYLYNATASNGHGRKVCCDCRGSSGTDAAWRYAEDSHTFLHPDWNGFETDDGTWLRDEPYESPYGDDDDNERGPLFNYSMRVQSVLGHIALVKGAEVPLPDSKALLFGVELETDADKAQGGASHAARHLVESAKDFAKWAICKSDGTVSGPEIVTVPACLDSHRELIPWAEWCKSARDFGLRGHMGHNAGIHVHVNRAALSALTLGKMLVFLNNEDNREFLEAIAQRTANQWCKRKPKTIGDGRRESQDKYEILNVAGRTAEFRMFKSNLLHERVFKNLEFCESLVRWCRTTPAGQLSARGYFVFLQDRASQYPFLHKFSADNKLERTVRTSESSGRPLVLIPGETEVCA